MNGIFCLFGCIMEYYLHLFLHGAYSYVCNLLGVKAGVKFLRIVLVLRSPLQ